MSRRKETCPTCGQAIMERPVRLSRSMINGLEMVGQAHEEERTFLLREIKDVYPMTSEYSHFYNLKYFGLVEKVLKADGTEVPGAWRITNKGLWFLLDWEDVPELVWVFDNRVIRTEGKVGVSDIPYVEVTKETVTEQWLPHDLQEQP